jgi:hypothetical protein
MVSHVEEFMEYLKLADAMSLLRQELEEAQDAAWDQQIRFEVIEAEVEFQIEVRSETGAEGKITLGVTTIGGNVKESRADTHRLRLKLNVADAATGGRHVDINRSDSRPWRR